MTAALATLFFLAVALLLVGIAAITLEENAAKIRAALKGRSRLSQAAFAAPRLRLSARGPAQRPVRAEARWRAAA